MEKPELQNLITALKKGVVTVVFKKINTEEIRIMPCTINETILEENGIKVGIKDIDSDSDQKPGSRHQRYVLILPFYQAALVY